MLALSMIGCGAISLEVLKLLQHEQRLRISQVIVPEHHLASSTTRLAFLTQPPRLSTQLAEDDQPDFLVECAGHAAIEEHVLPALHRGIPCLIVSIGALTDKVLAQRVEAAAQQGQTQVHLLSGAMAGIDALAAARLGGLDQVHYSGRKPPGAWRDTPAEQLCDLASLREAQQIFSGTARQAAQLYPKNANVAATLALAGMGLDQTQVTLWADPTLRENQHQLSASGAFGQLELTLQGKPLADNPKTSALTVYSVVRALMNRVQLITI